MRRPRPTHGLAPAERIVFWRVYGACCQYHAADLDVEEHCRQVAKVAVAAKAKVVA